MVIFLSITQGENQKSTKPNKTEGDLGIFSRKKGMSP
jgi:hypothetical protein